MMTKKDFEILANELNENGRYYTADEVKENAKIYWDDYKAHGTKGHVIQSLLEYLNDGDEYDKKWAEKITG